MTPVTVTFLGSGDAFGSGGRFQTCILVESPSSKFLIDCGASSLVTMKRQGIDPSTIRQIFVTHLHGDHFGGLPFFVLDAQFSKREDPLLVGGPPAVHPPSVWQVPPLSRKRRIVRTAHATLWLRTT